MFYPIMVGDGMSGVYASATAVQAESAARQARTDVELIKHDIDRLLLITEAMWNLMKQEHGYADDALTKMVVQIEAQRMKVGGLIAKDPPVTCPACGKLNSAKRPCCIYCGKPIQMANPFAR